MTTEGRVFVSGKEVELENERGTVIDVSQSMNFEPVASENRNASPNPVEREFLNEVRNSDIYIGLFGLEYSLPTIKEFQTARENNKPVYVFERELRYGDVRDSKLDEFLNTIKDPLNGVTVAKFRNVLDLRPKISDVLSHITYGRLKIKESDEVQKTETIENEKTKFPEIKIHPISISVKSDKAVYPPHASVHIRTFLNNIIQGEQIHVEVFNSNKKLLIYKKINPNVNKNIIKGEGYLFQTDFQMKGNDWVVGGVYTIIATHGLATSHDSFTMDRRNPVVQSDKSIYMLGSDMIITVVDPDANRDSQKAESTGNKPDGKLVVTSSFGQISGYKLIETGKDTGIFQGLMRIVPRHNKTRKNKILHASGKGPFDGQIPARRGEQLTCSYSNGHGLAVLTLYASNFGATVELDSKTYRWNDAVTLTIVAPDHNIDPNKKDIIGNRIDSKITISTSLGKISNYKLVETGVDTGIFTGAITLVGPGQKSIRKKNISSRQALCGPTDGTLRSGEVDEITVIFETDAGTFKASSNIQEYPRNI